MSRRVVRKVGEPASLYCRVRVQRDQLPAFVAKELPGNNMYEYGAGVLAVGEALATRIPRQVGL